MSNHVEINSFALLDESSQERFIADCIDQAGDSLAVAINAPQSGLGEIGGPFSAGDLQPMVNVLGDFVAA